jgi:hypothetical protein
MLADGSTHLVYRVTNLSTGSGQGLLGLTIDPDWPVSPYLYAYATRYGGGLKREILKIHVTAGHGDSASVIWTNPTKGGNIHDGTQSRSARTASPTTGLLLDGGREPVSERS